MPDAPPDSFTQRHVLANGLTVLVRRDASAPVAAIVTWVRAGYFDEPDDRVGISHVLEHMYFKGTPTRGVGDIARDTKAQGGYLNAHTIYDHTCYYAVVPSHGVERALEIQADAFHNSLIDPGELSRELVVIIEEAKRKADTPSAVATETLFELLHDRHRIRRWRIGREDGLRRLTSEVVRAFYGRHYRPEHTILCIVGDVAPEEILGAVERCYGGERPGERVAMRDTGPREDAKPGFRYRELSGDVAESDFLIGWRAPGALDADTVLLEQAALIFGTGRASRLYRAVRDRRLASSISAWMYTTDDVGVFVLHGDGESARTMEALEATWAEVLAVRERGFSSEEVERARRVQESRWLRRLETMEGQALHLAEWESSGGWERASVWLARALSASEGEIGEAVRRYLDPENAAVLVYRPQGAPALAANAADLARRLPVAAAPSGATSRATIQAPALHLRAVALEVVQGSVRVYRSSAGVPILVRRKPGAPVAHVGAYAARGAADEPPRDAGLTLLASRAMLRGTARRSANRVAEDAELLGGSVTPGVSSDAVGWTLSVPATRIGAAVELLADVVQDATLEDEGIEVERRVARSQLAQQRDDMYRHPLRLATEAAYGSHPYARSVYGEDTSLAALDAGAIRRWHATTVHGAPWVLAVVADGDLDAVAADVGARFSALAPAEGPVVAAPLWRGDRAAKEETRDKAQTALAMAFEGPARRDGDRFACHLLTGIASGLGGRLFEALRDRESLCYTVSTFSVERAAGGMLMAYIATSPDREGVARDGLVRELLRFTEGPVNDDELERVKAFAVGSHAISSQSGGALLAEMVDAWMYGSGLGELDEVVPRLRAVTAADILGAARRYLRMERCAEGVVRGGNR